MRKTQAEKIRDAKTKAAEPQVMTLEDVFLALVDPRKREQRQANPTQRQFAFDSSPFKAYMGPKGAAKTSSGAAAGWLRALFTPGSKGLVARRDYNDLKQTTKLRFEEMLGRLPKNTLVERSKDPPEVWTIRATPIYHPDTGELVSDAFSTITFAGLEMLGPGGSYEFDWALLDEASELESEKTFSSVNSLMRNLPSWWEELGVDPKTMYTIMLCFNPTDEFHWLYTACTGLNPQGRKVKEPYLKLFTPIIGENQRNLPADYYERIAVGMTEADQERLIKGRWGFSPPGAPVLREFRRPVHEKKDLMSKYIKSEPLGRFWDFGYRRPYCCWVQLDWANRLLHLKEILGENKEIDAFIDECRAKEKLWFPNHREFFDIGDPAARQKKDTGSTLIELQKKGIQLQFQIATIEDGLARMRYLYEQSREGEPVLQYDTDGVPVLIRALAGGYHMNEVTNKPMKDGVYDHPVDADRYGITLLFGLYQQGPGGSKGGSGGAGSDIPASLEYRPEMDVYGRF